MKLIIYFEPERMREMIDHRFFDHSKFFHVIPDFMVHMGIHQDRFENDRWDRMRIPDDSRENAVKNTMGTVAFITKGRNSRTTHMFINLRDNPPLDGSDLMPFARIVEGMETVREINGEYEERPDMFKAKEIGNEYLEKNFPRLSSIVRARYVQDDEEDTNDEL